MPTARVNGIDVCFETLGDDGDPTLLLVNGLGVQMIGYDTELCESLVALGLRVVRFDNRDVGLSTHFHEAAEPDLATAFLAALGGSPVASTYTLSDMAADAVGVLDHLGVDAAHLAGASMGAMVAQTVAIEHPQRVLSLTSIMSNTGEPGHGMPNPDLLVEVGPLLAAPAEEREARIEASLAISRAIGAGDGWDEDRARARATIQVDRCHDPAGVRRQLLAIFASGSRADGLAELSVPTTVLHGDRDRLIDISGGRRTAELVPDAEFHRIEGMGHDMAPTYWPRIVDAISAAIERAE